jgi:uncharacterized protein
MILELKVIPGAKKNLFKVEAGRNKVYLTAPAQEGRANKCLIEFLSEHFAVKKSAVNIIQGMKSRNKVVKIGEISRE